jgi:hypothetical protein
MQELMDAIAQHNAHHASCAQCSKAPYDSTHLRCPRGVTLLNTVLVMADKQGAATQLINPNG